MRLVTYSRNSALRLGAIISAWVLDLQLAQDLLGIVSISKSRKFPAGSIPAFLPEITAEESRFRQDVQEILHAIQELLPHSAGELEAKGVLLQIDRARLKPPITNPGKIIGAGMNYPLPGGDSGQRPPYPVLFLKPASTLTGHRQPILLPRISNRVVCEGELAVVIGRQGRHIPLEEALSYAAGYSAANDVSAQDLEQRTSQWTTGKLADTFCPLGPSLVTADEIPDPNRLSIRTFVNGVPVLSGNTSEMIFRVPELISYISELTTLLPGDIILTGSPKSVDLRPAPRLYLKSGDRISVEIERIGTLSNHVEREEVFNV